MLPEISKADMAGMIKVIEEYLSLCHGIIRASLAYITRKTMIVKTYGDYPKYTTLDDEMIARMLPLP